METTTRKESFYPWLVMVAAVLMCICASLFGGSFAISLSCVRNELALTGAQTSVFTTIRSFSAFIIVLFFDKWFEKLGIRKGVTLGLISGAIGMAFFAFAGTNLMIYNVGAVFGGICYGLCLMAAASLIVNRWFKKSKGLVIGFCSAASGICNFIFSPIIQSVSLSANVSAAFMIQLVVIVAIAIFCFLILREYPSDIGIEPYGGANYDASQDGKKKGGSKANYKTFLGSGAMWAYAVIVVFLGMAATPSQTYIPTCLNTVGFDPMVVAWAASTSGIIMIFSKTAFGIFTDKFGAKWTTLIYSIIIGVGSFIVLFALGFVNLPSFTPYIVYVCFGIGGAACTMGYTLFAIEWVSPEDHPKTMKKFQSAYQLGGLIASPLPGLVADFTGSYTNWYIVPFIGYMLMALGGFYLCVKIRNMRKAAGEIA
ncbi:MAG: MFS transporter [Firmicutes bacterium]|nr:MFS transporter [Bacillota bacterium]